MDLSENKIGDVGVKHLNGLLETNQVKYISEFSILMIIFFHSTQIITMINLSKNHIGDTGTQYLANVLQNNAVIYYLSLFKY